MLDRKVVPLVPINPCYSLHNQHYPFSHFGIMLDCYLALKLWPSKLVYGRGSKNRGSVYTVNIGCRTSLLIKRFARKGQPLDELHGPNISPYGWCDKKVFHQSAHLGGWICFSCYQHSSYYECISHAICMIYVGKKWIIDGDHLIFRPKPSTFFTNKPFCTFRTTSGTGCKAKYHKRRQHI